MLHHHAFVPGHQLYSSPTSGRTARRDTRNVGLRLHATSPALDETSISTDSPTVPPLEESCDIVVAGGGIGGLTTALRLLQLPWSRPTRILLVDAKDRYNFQPLMVDYAVSDVVELDDFAPTYSSLLEYALRERTPPPPFTYHATVDFLQANISSVENGERQLEGQLPSGDTVVIRYESMVLAPGLRQEFPVPGQTTSPIAQRFATLEDAEMLKARLSTLNNTDKIVVVGGNYVGVELAVSLAEEGWNVTLFAGSTLLGSSRPETRRQASDKLQELAVDVKLAYVNEVLSDGVRWQSTAAPASGSNSSEGAEGKLGCAAVLVSGAGRGPPEEFCFAPRGSAGPARLSVDRRLQAAPGVFCLGDAANSGAALTGQAAIAQAEIAAWNVYALQMELPSAVWRDFESSDALGEFVALGREEAAGAVNTWRLPAVVPSALPGLAAQAAAPFAELAASLGPEKELNVSGMPAAAIRRLAYLYRLPTLGHRLKVAARWARRLADWQESQQGLA